MTIAIARNPGASGRRNDFPAWDLPSAGVVSGGTHFVAVPVLVDLGGGLPLDTTTWRCAGARLDGVLEGLRALEDLASLPPNWDGDGSPPIRTAALVAAAGILRDLARPGLPAPFVCPVPGGGVQLEWSIGDRHLEIEVVDDRQAAFVRDGGEGPGSLPDAGDFHPDWAGALRPLVQWLLSG
jgi:hypothetical protein